MNKKLSLALVVVCALGATTLAACGKSSTSIVVTPVTDINVTRPENDIIVGDSIDLDQFVSVEGGAGANDYTITVRPASKDVVSVEGHTLSVLKEGPINLLIEAGEQSSLISWESLSKLKSEYKKATESITTDYAVLDLDYNTRTKQMYLTGEGTVHNERYFYAASYPKDSKKLVGEGMVLLDDGFIYDIEGEGMDCKNLKVLPGPEAGDMWEYYFINMGYNASYSYLETVVMNEGTKDEYSYLYLPASVKAPAGMGSYAANMADYVMLTTFGFSLQFQDAEFKAAIDVTSTSMVIENVAADPTNPIYSLMIQAKGAKGTEYAGEDLIFAWGLLSTDEEDIDVKSISSYIESGELPEKIDITEVTSTCDALKAFTNYTQETTYKSIGADSKQEISGDQVISGTVLTQVDGTNKVLNNQVLDDAGNVESNYGYYESGDKLYFYAPKEKGEGYDVEVAEGASSFDELLEILGVSSWASIGTEDLVGFSREEKEGTTTIVVKDYSDYGEFALTLLNTLPLYGRGFVETLGSAEGIRYVKNAAMTWSYSATSNELKSIEVSVPISYQGTVEDFSVEVSMKFSEVGTTDCSSILALFVD